MGLTAVTAAGLAYAVYNGEKQQKEAKNALKNQPKVPTAEAPDAAAQAVSRQRRLAGVVPPTNQLTGPLGVTGAAPTQQKTLLGM